MVNEKCNATDSESYQYGLMCVYEVKIPYVLSFSFVILLFNSF